MTENGDAALQTVDARLFTDRQTDTHTHRQTHTQTDTQTDRQTDTQTDMTNFMIVAHP